MIKIPRGKILDFNESLDDMEHILTDISKSK